MDSWPWSNIPLQVFVPLYVPWKCVIMSSISNVPVPVAEHEPDIIDPDGIVIVKVPEWPFIVPDTVIGPPM